MPNLVVLGQALPM